MTMEPVPSCQGRIAGVVDASVPPEAVLRRLQSADTLCHCIPGAKSVAPDGQDRFAVYIEGSVGPFEARIEGALAVTADPDGQQCRLHAKGGSSSASTGEIDIGVTVDQADDGCRLVYDGTIAVVGTAAAMGDRIVETMANMLARLFFDRLLGAVPADPETADPETAAREPVDPGPADPEPAVAEGSDAPRLGLNPQVWVPGLCVALLMLVLVFRI